MAKLVQEGEDGVGHGGACGLLRRARGSTSTSSGTRGWWAGQRRARGGDLLANVVETSGEGDENMKKTRALGEQKDREVAVRGSFGGRAQRAVS